MTTPTPSVPTVGEARAEVESFVWAYLDFAYPPPERGTAPEVSATREAERTIITERIDALVAAVRAETVRECEADYRRVFFEVRVPDGTYVGDFEVREHAEAFAAGREGFVVVESHFVRYPVSALATVRAGGTA